MHLVNKTPGAKNKKHSKKTPQNNRSSQAVVLFCTDLSDQLRLWAYYLARTNE